jgi:ATP-dependent Clp protease ATP-binding subunit ClpB
VEKAHPEVFNIFLQILDDGRLTDSQGRTVDFRNTVIIMTSNVGSHYILEQAGAGDWGVVEDHVLGELRRHFRPELLNRIDDTIVFRPLGREELRRIVELQLGRLRSLLADRGITLELTPAAEQHIAEVGHDPAFGARPLKRAIQRLVQNPLALLVLEDRFGEGDVVRADVDPSTGELRFDRVGARATP